MCKCRPEVRTPFCGRPGCEWPERNVTEPVSQCEHQYEFLRQDKDNVGFDRNPRWAYYDVYFCSRCLEYQKVKVLETVPAQQSFGEDVVWRK